MLTQFLGKLFTVVPSSRQGLNLLSGYLPLACVAAIASIRRELGTGWAAGVAVWQCVLAWIAAFAVQLIGNLVGFV